MFERFTDRARRVVVLAQEDARELNHTSIGTEHLLLGLLHMNTGIAHQVLESFGVTHEAVYRLVDEFGEPSKRGPSGHMPFTSRAKTILELSLQESQLQGSAEIDTHHILLGLVREGHGVGMQILAKLGVEPQTVRSRVDDLTGYQTTDLNPADLPTAHTPLSETPSTENPSTETQSTGPAREPIASATPLGRLRGLLTGSRVLGDPEPAAQPRRTVARVSRNPEWDRPPGQNLTESGRMGLLDPVTGRETLTELLMEALCRRKRNNVLLIGESGVGKTALIGAIVGAIADGRVPLRLAKAELWQVDHVALWTARVRTTAGQVSGNSVLVVEDLDLLLAADGPSTGFAAATLNAMCHSARQLIATITPTGHQALTANQPLLAAQFQCIDVPEAGTDETVAILTVLRDAYQKHHGVTITDEALAAAPALAARHLPGRRLPGAAIDLVDAAGARLQVAAVRSYDAEGSADQPPATAVVDEQLLIAIADELTAA